MFFKILSDKYAACRVYRWQKKNNYGTIKYFYHCDFSVGKYMDYGYETVWREFQAVPSNIVSSIVHVRIAKIPVKIS